MKGEEKVDWVILANATADNPVPPNAARALCQRCHKTEDVEQPLPLKAFVKWLDFVMEKHRFCKGEAA